MSWTALLALAAGTYLLRVTGVLLRGRVAMPDRVQRYLDLGATALLVALAATAALIQDGGFAGWARPAGVLVGVVLAWRRVPFVLVVALAAAGTAGLRWAGVP
ncbi:MULTISPECIES: AzlD domain-containing protein [unclassified Pseudonocardia]|jgi:branched-subunit amino acid transport protein|uniref:AzlD domain-containing protein n=1 Tax=unclassified Pseudonocardia TaxID=2619320 RepID=UPI000967CF88|nr:MULTISPECIES: AzlD domain-containing protein [unclassified Pseudonocardia]MBN9097716.1 AzlD domain-containing protein [Pseudonocardia sp.]OJY40009.1 MAG: branched-chain amino acid transporter [Pseudonocardia sp. 73-21]